MVTPATPRPAGAVPTVRDASLDLFRAHGMTTIFGSREATPLPSGRSDDLRYVLGLHAGVALAMADGYAQATGTATLVNLPNLSGVASAMGALVNAAAAKSPLVIVAGQPERSRLTMQAGLATPDPAILPRPLVKWSFEPPRPQDVPAALARAIAAAQTPPRGPVLVSVPSDDWVAAAPAPLPARVVHARPAPRPSAIRIVAERLAAAANPALLVGAGVDAEGGWEAAVVLAQRCALPVYWAPMEHRCGFPTANPAFQGVLPASPGELGLALAGHDFVLVAGATAFRYYAEACGEPVLAPGTQLMLITSDPDEAARIPCGDAVVGDVGLALRWLVAAVPATDRVAPPPGPPPPAVSEGEFSLPAAFAAVAAARPADAVLVVEPASGLRCGLEQIRFERPGSFFANAGASLGFGLPGSIGIQLGRPDRRVLAVVGDLAFQHGAPALWSLVHYGVPVTVIVLRSEAGYAHRPARPEEPNLDGPGLDHVALAHGYGVRAELVQTAAELTQAVRRAVVQRAPYLIEVPVKAAYPALAAPP